MSGLIASGLKLSMACHQRIPNLIHFCYGLCENPPFGFLEYLAIKSAIDLNQPDAVFFHHKYLPSGTWWESIRPLLTLVAVDPPTEIFGNRIWHHAHQADVIRLNALIEHGGIYLDIDTLCVRSFDDLRTHKCVMGKQSEKRGLCNAVILAEPQSAFLRAWLDRYRDFDPDEWDEHSVQLPMTLAQNEQLIDKIHVLDVDRFFFPDWEHMDALFESQDQALFSNSYCIHYWASITGKRWLNRATLASIYARDTNFSIMARRHLLNSNADALSK